MNNQQIFVLIVSIFASLITYTLFVILLTNKFLTLNHTVTIMKQQKSVGDVNVIVSEDFNDVKPKCENKSLNEMHSTGINEKKPWKTSCEAKMSGDEGGESFYKKYKPYKMIYTADKVEQGILGSNYMAYATNPDPYKLDYTLYDKSQTKIQPVGSNYDITQI